jgi:hypothetical protein
MSDNKRTITINPELFKITTANKSRKKTDATGGKIKVKSASPKKRDNTLKKKSILKMIRQHQEDKYKKLFGEKHRNTTNEIQKEIDSISQIDSDFEESKKFLMKLAEENEEKEKHQRLNATIKRYPHDNNTDKMSLLYENVIPTFDTFEDVHLTFPNEATQITPTVSINPRATSFLQPKFGCLKNGSLPTYRHYMNKTMKQTQPILPEMNSIISVAPPSLPMNTLDNAIVENKINNKIQENIKKMSEMKQMMTKLEAIKNNKIKKCMRQKRIVRRTYKIGKSKVLPRISVLVSNKTLRNNTTTKCQLLKQDSIADIKKYLIKRGLIKVGTSAPNDVLRKMYESCVMICGEVQNHNPENLLHNFLNGKEEF